MGSPDIAVIPSAARRWRTPAALPASDHTGRRRQRAALQPWKVGLFTGGRRVVAAAFRTSCNRGGNPPAPPLHVPRHTRRGFTAIELLAVLAILMILLALLFPVTARLRHAAEQRTAGADTRALVQAVKAYRATHGLWPGQTNAVAGDLVWDDASPVLSVLTNAAADPRGICFLDVRPSAVASGRFLDPWGAPYVLAMDADGDDRLTFSCVHPFLPALTNAFTNLPETAAVVSWGYDPESSDALRVYSWR